MNSMAVMGGAGDTKIIWDPANDDEVKTAKRTFDDLLKKGFTAFKVEKGGDKGDKITDFDKDAEKLILVPRMAGG